MGFQHGARLANTCTERQTATMIARAINSPVFPPALFSPTNIIEEKVRVTDATELFFYHPGSNFRQDGLLLSGAE